MIAFSPATGRLRLDPGTFEVLTSASSAADTVPVELRDCQAWTAEGPHPLLRPTLAAVRSPVCQLRVTVTGPAAHSLHQLWVSPEAAAVLAHVEKEQYDLFAVAPCSVHEALARLLRLGPRTRASTPSGPVTVPADVLGKVVHAAVPADRIAAFARLFDAAPEAVRTRWAAVAAAGTTSGRCSRRCSPSTTSLPTPDRSAARTGALPSAAPNLQLIGLRDLGSLHYCRFAITGGSLFFVGLLWAWHGVMLMPIPGVGSPPGLGKAAAPEDDAAEPQRTEPGVTGAIRR